MHCSKANPAPLPATPQKQFPKPHKTFSILIVVNKREKSKLLEYNLAVVNPP